MIEALLTAWILTAGGPAVRPTGATQVVHFDFAELPDRSSDKPEGWKREYGPGYPYYVDAELTREAAVVATRSLLFRLNGGNCAYFSPSLPASRDYNYILQGQIKTVGLVHDRAFLMLEFLDEKNRLVGQQHLSPLIEGTTDWTTVRIGETAPISDAVRFLRIACITQHGVEMDLTGKVYFDDLWIGRLPRYEVSTSSPYRLFDLDKPKIVRVRVTGAESRRYNARFYLFDENREPLGEKIEDLAAAGPGARTAEWSLPINDVGYYHLEIGLNEGNRRVLLRDFPVTVVRPLFEPARGEFGISGPVPRLGLAHYERLLEASAARWLRLPLWAKAELNEELKSNNRALARFIERIQSQGRAVVGSLESAPPSIMDNLPPRATGIADVFTLPKDKWANEIDGLMARRGLEITYWQVGADDDTSFEGLRNQRSILRRLSREMNLIGRDVQLGLAWSWLAPPPTGLGLAFLSFTDQPEEIDGASTANVVSPFTADRLLEYIRKQKLDLAQPPAATSTAAPARPWTPTKIWTQLAPLSEARYERKDRLLDFARRIAAAKIGGSDAIFCVDIADPDHGLYDESGAPTEMFTVWRTMTEHLGGADYVGQLYIPGVAENRVFATAGRATIMLRGDPKTSAEIIAGPGAMRTDLWGRRTALSNSTATQRVPLSDLPILISGASEPLVRFQLGVRFLKGRLTSEIGPQSDALEILNPFPVALSGRVKVGFPPSWRARPDVVTIQIPPGKSFVAPITFDIPQGTAQQRYLIPLEFDLSSDRNYRFRMPYPYRLGGEEIDAVTTTRLMANGDLEVELTVTNLTSTPMELRCSARAFQRNVEQALFASLGPRETGTRRLVVPRGRELIGTEIRIDIEQIGGRRQFTLKIIARE